MTQPKWTPGPWQWEIRDHVAYLRQAGAMGTCPDFDGNDPIADDGSAGGEYSRTIQPDSPNAQLIAAAPDLFSALVEAQDVIAGAGLVDEFPIWVIEAIDAALAKALGEPHVPLANVAAVAKDQERFDKLERLAAQCGKQYWRVNHIGELERSSIKIGDLDWYESPRAAIDAAPEPKHATPSKMHPSAFRHPFVESGSGLSGRVTGICRDCGQSRESAIHQGGTHAR